MVKKRYDLWESGEYTYPLSFGFQPNLVSYLHEDTDEPRPCVIVVPGGGYRIVSPSEGEIVAKKFYGKGYQTFVCTYTVNITGAAPLKDQPVKDLARAVRYVRKNAKDLGVDKDRVAVCGFSAGGHVCGSLCVHYEDIEEKNSEYADCSPRPDAGLLCYPVISSGNCGHSDSFKMLLGDDADPTELEYASLEKQVTQNTPPCFLWQTATDELVPVENSYLMAQALKEKGIPFAHHIFSQGRHGLSLANQEWADENYGEPYTMEQVFRFVELVKSGRIPCTNEEREQLPAAFDYSDESREIPRPKCEPNREVEIWPDLADWWLQEIFSKKEMKQNK
ncbi:MAG TPA: alpha/beta hydrolase [Candidatus Blautia faecipullorum]|nr:alpha/beta hydrolase [Candidatus Blautia faecipullorum]